MPYIKRTLLRKIIIILLTMFPIQSIAKSTDWQLDQLMKELSSIDTAALTFEESRKSAFLTTVLHTSGRMVYRRPEHLEKHVLEPFVERIFIEEDQMKVIKFSRRGKKKEKIYPVDSHKSLHIAVKAIRAVLDGDTDYLKTLFDMDLSGDRDAWELKMIPIEKRNKHRLEKAILLGTEKRITEVMTFEKDGDETHLKLNYQLIR